MAALYFPLSNPLLQTYQLPAYTLLPVQSMYQLHYHIYSLYNRLAVSVPVCYKYLIQTHHNHIQLDILLTAQEGELYFQDDLKHVFTITYISFILFYSHPVSKTVIAIDSFLLFPNLSNLNQAYL